MTNDFEQRLNAVNAKARAQKAQADEAQARTVANQETKVRKAQEAINAWNSRIAALIKSIAEQANPLIKDTGLRLVSEAFTPYTLDASGVGPQKPHMPWFLVTGTGLHQ